MWSTMRKKAELKEGNTKDETVKFHNDHSLRADVINIYFPYITTKLFNSPDETCKFGYGSPWGTDLWMILMRRTVLHAELHYLMSSFN